ncbi:MAG: DUF6456 domain-containing protein [Rickettsiales bacterium]
MAKRKRKQKSGIQVKGPSLLPDRAAGLPTPEFAARNALETVKTDLGSYALRVRDKRPIDKYHRLWRIDEERGMGEHYRRGISEDQFRAADRFSCNHERTTPRMSMQLAAVRVQNSTNVGLYPVESIMEACHLHERLMKQLSKQSRAIVLAVCCNEGSLTDYEHVQGWRKGYGMSRLREALDELAEAFAGIGKANRRVD